MKSLLSDYTRYNFWVNERLVNLFKSVDPQLIDKEIVSSFPSIRATLLHLWDVETLWLLRLNGISPTEFPSKNFKGGHDDIYQGLLKSSQDFVDFVQEKPVEFFYDDITFTLMTASGTFTQSAGDMVHHCMNHQTFHRGQLITMARQLGITEFPRTDYIMFKRGV
jgi:uncharacterized damage-inducible protein DinB